jgi:hypothetical protein
MVTEVFLLLQQGYGISCRTILTDYDIGAFKNGTQHFDIQQGSLGSSASTAVSTGRCSINLGTLSCQVFFVVRQNV